jgi:hypothetical protein
MRRIFNGKSSQRQKFSMINIPNDPSGLYLMIQTSMIHKITDPKPEKEIKPEETRPKGLDTKLQNKRNRAAFTNFS